MIACVFEDTEFNYEDAKEIGLVSLIFFVLITVMQITLWTPAHWSIHEMVLWEIGAAATPVIAIAAIFAAMLTVRFIACVMIVAAKAVATVLMPVGVALSANSAHYRPGLPAIYVAY